MEEQEYEIDPQVIAIRSERIAFLYMVPATCLMPFVWSVIYAGHTPISVAVGIIVGVFAGCVLMIGVNLLPYDLDFKNTKKQQENTRRQAWNIGYFLLLNISIFITTAIIYG